MADNQQTGRSVFVWRCMGAARVAMMLGAASVLAACVQAPARYNDPYAQGGYQQAPAYPQPQQQPAYQQAPYGVEYGVVGRIEELRSQARGTSGVGAILGAVVGGIVGNQIGGGFGRAAATAAGVGAGALAGNAIEQQNGGSSAVRGYRIVINLQQGGQRIFDVPHPGDLRPGDRVQINQGQISRY